MNRILFENTFDIVVCDSETLGRWDDAIVLSVAMTHADLRRPHTAEELVEEHTFFMKFDAMEQANLGRKKEAVTSEWWTSDRVSDAARQMSLFKDPERDRSVRGFVCEYESWAHLKGFEPRKAIHTDRNLFDLRKLQHIIEVSLGEKYHPWDYHDIEDLVTRLKSYVGDRYNDIDIRKIENAVYHDPRWDAAIDWLRLQKAAQMLELIELGGS